MVGVNFIRHFELYGLFYQSPFYMYRIRKRLEGKFRDDLQSWEDSICPSLARHRKEEIEIGEKRKRRVDFYILQIQ